MLSNNWLKRWSTNLLIRPPLVARTSVGHRRVVGRRGPVGKAAVSPEIAAGIRGCKPEALVAEKELEAAEELEGQSAQGAAGREAQLSPAEDR
jgi:hypothetical protein